MQCVNFTGSVYDWRKFDSVEDFSYENGKNYIMEYVNILIHYTHSSITTISGICVKYSNTFYFLH